MTKVRKKSFSEHKKIKSDRKKALGGTLFWDIPQQEERKIITQWSQKRKLKLLSNRSFYYKGVLQYTFTLETLISFAKNFNFMVIIQIIIAIVSVYLSNLFDLSVDVDVNLFVTPIVFPLAFSINADFQRREKVLDDIANFKSAGMSWFISLRDWRVDSNLDMKWFHHVHQKLQSMLFNMREYLLTKKLCRRSVILEAIYEDFSDANQLVECVRKSKLQLNSPLVARVYLALLSIFTSFERLRIIREYRSPRSIRSFNKVLIFFLPMILSPYFHHVGVMNKSKWAPYVFSVLLTFFFSALQGVHDILDDPFNGLSEDDIKLSSVDEWLLHSLEVVKHRSFSIRQNTPRS
ncbi:uncharacterized protein LOC124810360 [Hydra vulgaris]|uniref:Uncharacterized protein LOC124810360 n=1 Tax=Hydra vulgaris TaxID=6087 RepID=A0ABM4B4S8_HYDVU